MNAARPQRLPIALRPYLPPDAPVLAEIFRVSIEELTGEDYNEEQQRAWVAAADDEEAFAHRSQNSLSLIATLGGEPVGFASLEGKDHIDLLYVHPAVARQGVGTMLVRCAGKARASRAARPKLTVDASDTAQDFFRQRGYEAQSRNTVMAAANGSPTPPWTRSSRRGDKPNEIGGKPAGHAMTKPDTPFPRHWLYYFTWKFVVIAAAVALAL